MRRIGSQLPGRLDWVRGAAYRDCAMIVVFLLSVYRGVGVGGGGCLFGRDTSACCGWLELWELRRRRSQACAVLSDEHGPELEPDAKGER